MTVTLTFLTTILFLRRSDSKRFLIVHRTTFLAIFPACVVHAFTLRQFACVLIIFINFFSTFSSMTIAAAPTLSYDRLNWVVTSLQQVILVWFPFQRPLVFDFTDIFQQTWGNVRRIFIRNLDGKFKMHTLKANSDVPSKSKIQEIRCECLDWSLIEN